MQRGVVSFTNLEVRVLHNFVVSHGCEKKELLSKISPTNDRDDSAKIHNVFFSEEEAETMLDCMPIPGQDNDFNLMNVRIKIQEFLTKSRFPESSS